MVTFNLTREKIAILGENNPHNRWKKCYMNENSNRVRTEWWNVILKPATWVMFFSVDVEITILLPLFAILVYEVC